MTRERERCGESGLEGGGRSGEERNEVVGVCALDRWNKTVKYN